MTATNSTLQWKEQLEFLVASWKLDVSMKFCRETHTIMACFSLSRTHPEVVCIFLAHEIMDHNFKKRCPEKQEGKAAAMIQSYQASENPDQHNEWANFTQALFLNSQRKLGFISFIASPVSCEMLRWLCRGSEVKSLCSCRRSAEVYCCHSSALCAVWQLLLGFGHYADDKHKTERITVLVILFSLISNPDTKSSFLSFLVNEQQFYYFAEVAYCKNQC